MAAAAHRSSGGGHGGGRREGEPVVGRLAEAADGDGGKAGPTGEVGAARWGNSRWLQLGPVAALALGRTRDAGASPDELRGRRPPSG